MLNILAGLCPKFDIKITVIDRKGINRTSLPTKQTSSSALNTIFSRPIAMKSIIYLLGLIAATQAAPVIEGNKESGLVRAESVINPDGSYQYGFVYIFSNFIKEFYYFRDFHSKI